MGDSIGNEGSENTHLFCTKSPSKILKEASKNFFSRNKIKSIPKGKHIPSRAGFTGDWGFDKHTLMKALANGEVSMDSPELQAMFLDWMESEDFNQFINKSTGEVSYNLVPRRGNLPYASRKSVKRKEITDALEGKVFDWEVPGSRIYRRTKMLFVTFNFDRTKFTKEQAWAALRSTPIEGSDVKYGVINNLTANLRKIFGSFGKLVSKEAQYSGYPAPHMIILLDKPVLVKQINGKYGPSWRLVDPKILRRIGKDSALRNLAFKNHKKAMDLNPIWKHGFIDFEGIVQDTKFRGRKNIANYLFKYVSKCLVKGNTSETELFDSINSISEKNLRTTLATHFGNKCFCTRDITNGEGFKKRIGILSNKSELPKDPSPWRREKTISGHEYQRIIKGMMNNFRNKQITLEVDSS